MRERNFEFWGEKKKKIKEQVLKNDDNLRNFLDINQIKKEGVMTKKITCATIESRTEPFDVISTQWWKILFNCAIKNTYIDKVGQGL